jgi:tetratricopeptide (TPR) repeat protein
MVGIEKKEAFIKQTALFLKNNQDEKALALGEEFASKFPLELMAHFLLAKADFALERYEECEKNAEKALALSKTPEDRLAVTTLLGTAQYMLHDYRKGFNMLKRLGENEKSEELEQMLFIFSVALKDDREALLHIDRLNSLNQKLAEDLIKKFARAWSS